MNLNKAPKKLILLGIGDVLASIEDDPVSFGLSPGSFYANRFEAVDQISVMAVKVLANLNPSEYSLFVSVDSNALNHARLEIYGQARLLGFKMANLIHSSAILSPSIQIADNVYVGPGVVIGPASKIASNSFIGSTARIDSRVTIGSHCWIGAGSKIGSDSRIDAHVVLGEDTLIDKNTDIEHHVLIEQKGPWHGKWRAGTFLEKHAANAAITVGPSYSYMRKLSS